MFIDKLVFELKYQPEGEAESSDEEEKKKADGDANG